MLYQLPFRHNFNVKLRPPVWRPFGIDQVGQRAGKMIPLEISMHIPVQPVYSPLAYFAPFSHNRRTERSEYADCVRYSVVGLQVDSAFNHDVINLWLLTINLGCYCCVRISRSVSCSPRRSEFANEAADMDSLLIYRFDLLFIYSCSSLCL